MLFVLALPRESTTSNRLLTPKGVGGVTVELADVVLIGVRRFSIAVTDPVPSADTGNRLTGSSPKNRFMPDAHTVSVLPGLDACVARVAPFVVTTPLTVKVDEPILKVKSLPPPVTILSPVKVASAV
jgi:hypothetical protein